MQVSLGPHEALTTQTLSALQTRIELVLPLRPHVNEPFHICQSMTLSLRSYVEWWAIRGDWTYQAGCRTRRRPEHWGRQRYRLLGEALWQRRKEWWIASWMRVLGKEDLNLVLVLEWMMWLKSRWCDWELGGNSNATYTFHPGIRWRLFLIVWMNIAGKGKDFWFLMLIGMMNSTFRSIRRHARA